MEILITARALCRIRESLLILSAVALGVVAMASGSAGAVPEEPPDEYQVKAAFLFNFAKLVEWPAELSGAPNGPVTVCILGLDPFGRSLADTLSGRSIGGRPLVVRHIANMKQVSGCQILFIGSDENKRSHPLLPELGIPGILTIGESDAPDGGGVIINFRLDSGKVRFDINLDAADHEKLRISSRLLSLAHLVQSNRK